MATSNSGVRRLGSAAKSGRYFTNSISFDRGQAGPTTARRRRRFESSLRIAAAVFVVVTMVGPLEPNAQAEPPLTKAQMAQAGRVQSAFEEARTRWKADSNHAEVAWTFARAAFDWADFATNDHQRSTVAELGIAACRRALVLDSNSAPAYYYMGLNQGQVARTKLLGALHLLGEMESSWQAAIRLDPGYDYAGPHRSLGVLYRDAPGWPTSIGSEKKARFNLEKAVALHPEYPGNRLSLYEGWIEWGDRKAIREKASEMETYMEKAHTDFQGERWALDWEDWDHRWAEIKRRAGIKTPKEKPSDSPTVSK